MGERLGRVEALVQQGIMPIPPERGAATLLQALRESGPVSRIITGRFGQPPTLTLDEAELPLHRFLERKRVFYPGVELVVDAELSIASDPYLNDHIVQRQRLLPAVVGLEAMAQTAMAVVGSSAPPAFENVALSRPVTVSEKSPTTIRVAALRRGPGVVDVCLRSEETDYQVDHFRAICRFGATVPSIRCDMADRSERREQPLDPQKDLYGRVLFHQGRFCRISNYQRLSARECVAEISESEAELWFGPYLPVEFVLGDPAARDAALHAIQACIPHQRILPTGIDRLQVGQACPRGSRFVHARERLRKGNDFTYDVEIRNRAGELVEIWEGLHLRAVEPLTPPETWPVPLLAPYLERRIEELSNGRAVSVAFDRGPSRAKTKRVQPVERLERSDRAIVRALGVSTRVWRRGDGKPLVANGQSVSAAHAEGFTLAVAGDGRVACDLEALVSRTESAWRDLLGPERFKVASRVSSGQGLDSAATRLWNAFECLKKAGLPADAPLVLDSASADGWVIVRSGSLAIATCILSVRGSKVPLSIAVAFDTISTSSTRYTAEAVT
jgi:enediyne polyketide synthase